MFFRIPSWARFSSFVYLCVSSDFIKLLYVGDLQYRCIARAAPLYFQLPPSNFSRDKPLFKLCMFRVELNTLQVSPHSPLSSFRVPFYQQPFCKSFNPGGIPGQLLAPAFSCHLESVLLLICLFMTLVELRPSSFCFAVAVTSDTWFLPVSLLQSCSTVFPKRVFWTFLPSSFSDWNYSLLFHHLQGNFFSFLRDSSRVSGDVFPDIPSSSCFWGGCPSVFLHCSAVAACATFIMN